MREGQRKKLIKAGIGKAIKATKKQKMQCLVPDCEAEAINSHSQQKKGQLVSIAEDGFVYAMNRNLYQLVDTEKKELFKKEHISKATTFKGFCNKHDTEIFQPIESEGFDIENAEHNFLLLLRAICYECSTKKIALEQKKRIVRYCSEYFTEAGRMRMDLTILGNKQFFDKDAPYYLKTVFDIYNSKDWGKIKYKSFTINKNMGVSATTCFNPQTWAEYSTFDTGNIATQPFIALSLVPSTESSSISFAWFEENNETCKEFLKFNPHDESSALLLNKILIVHSEDYCVRPSIWEQLTETERSQTIKYMGEDFRDLKIEIPKLIQW